MDERRRSSPLHIVSPLVPSNALSECCGRRVLLKLESTQPSGSFKIRGLGHQIQTSANEGVRHIVTSSGGNAGMAAAYAANKMGIAATVVIPASCPQMMITRLKHENATVVVSGQEWDDANDKAHELARNDPSLHYIHPFNSPLIWEGAQTLVQEILEQEDEKPAAIVVAVGGGGLLCGILQELRARALSDVAVVTMETEGADCFNQALKVGHPVSIGKITSIAHTLGALTVVPRVFDLLPGMNLSSHVITDREAISACSKFADDHRILVEPSCGAAIAAGYSGIVKKLSLEGKIPSTGPVIIVVCGGNGVTLDILSSWKEQFNIC